MVDNDSLDAFEYANKPLIDKLLKGGEIMTKKPLTHAQKDAEINILKTEISVLKEQNKSLADAKQVITVRHNELADRFNALLEINKAAENFIKLKL